VAHAHEGHDHGIEVNAGRRRALAGALAMTLAFTAVEVVGGLLTDSLALLSDAAHMVTDNVSLALALFAVWLAAKPASPQRSFGFRRAEVLAALANGVTLVAVSIWIFIEAASRIAHPEPVLGGWMLAIAVVGLLVNVAAALLLRSQRRDSINVEAAFRHVLGDLAGSLGTIVAAAIIVATGWTYADPVVSILIGVLILLGSWTILRDSVAILMEHAPPGLDVAEVAARITEQPGVTGVHDLHVWIITTGFPAIAAHVTCEADADTQVCRQAIEEMLRDDFGIAHATLQMEEDGSEPVCTLLSCGR
jgi:cobalt-zinc-cadmium efflux system protein